MLSSDGREDDVFFDSPNQFSCNESFVAEAEFVSSEVQYELWMKEPQSIRERRERFLHKMGLVEYALKHDAEQWNLTEMMGFNRISECSDAVSNSVASARNEAEDNSVECLEHNQECGGDVLYESKNLTLSHSAKQCDQREAQADVEDCRSCIKSKQKSQKWWKRLMGIKERGVTCKEGSEQNVKAPGLKRTKVNQNKKRYSEFSALYTGQEIQAHNGLIRSMKFSPDGQYLGTGGEDGVVRIWKVTSTRPFFQDLRAEGNCSGKVKGNKHGYSKKGFNYTSIFIPDKAFQIEELPLHEYHGHSADVLDLAWSNSNYLLSSSMDKTVRLWQLGCDQCVHVFHHKDCVTCIQFNPVSDGYFISGSIDGKVRVWGVSERRVVDWVDLRDLITAICYRPDGKGFVVGSITGTCHFYESSGQNIQLEAQIHIPGKKKTSGNKITGIQFPHNNSQRVMITSEDSKIRILNGDDVVCKYRGFSNSGSPLIASLTSSQKHIISVGEDSRVYIWNYEDSCISSSSKQTKSIRSCEYFYSEGACIAASWPGKVREKEELDSSFRHLLQMQDRLEAASLGRDSERFSLGNWFTTDGPCRGSATWPEEKLPLWDVSVNEEKYIHLYQDGHERKQEVSKPNNRTALSEMWGLVIVTAGWDGKIKTFHNYGLPVRL